CRVVLPSGLGSFPTRRSSDLDERPVGGELVGLEGAFGVVADHERDAALPEQLVDVVREPARMPKLEAVAARRQLGKGSRQPVVVAVEILRQLPQHRSELARAPQRLNVLVEPSTPGRMSASRFMWVR